ncbi:hypothetical protein J577_0781 [Acinetobacter sp. 263903-1]|nr:hypothetical protein J546_1793 [Acinetobacter sp. 1461402]EXB71716.1 hypothetical protein J550_1984 [Acinetobacter sp. 230853]EXB87598.1 hypothetical protein J538_0486 [Acinetobacter sp. 272263]EXC31098.1 hypothetical protein J520_2347 [Acinetobacter sp. 869535]EXF58341.1 hypothetical protein J502_0530 [Acinetobacter sp. 1294596]KCX38402.1 hypothetical protein J577_0781 [Acinetobacter sp. 263903-1]
MSFKKYRLIDKKPPDLLEVIFTTHNFKHSFILAVPHRL